MIVNVSLRIPYYISDEAAPTRTVGQRPVALPSWARSVVGVGWRPRVGRRAKAADTARPRWLHASYAPRGQSPRSSRNPWTPIPVVSPASLSTTACRSGSVTAPGCVLDHHRTQPWLTETLGVP
jgi:hypothetical protein